MRTTTTRTASVLLGVGLATTIVATMIPFLGNPAGSAIAEHVRDGYPAYSAQAVASAVDAYLIGLGVIGALGAVAWIVALALTRSHRTAARWVATAAFLVGTALAVFDLVVRDTSGDTGLPLSVGLVGLLPSVVGMIAVLALWKHSTVRGLEAR